MPVSAVAKDTGYSVKKVKPIIDMIRGMNVEEALNALRFLPSPIRGAGCEGSAVRPPPTPRTSFSRARPNFA